MWFPWPNCWSKEELQGIKRHWASISYILCFVSCEQGWRMMSLFKTVKTYWWDMHPLLGTNIWVDWYLFVDLQYGPCRCFWQDQAATISWNNGATIEGIPLAHCGCVYIKYWVRAMGANSTTKIWLLALFPFIEKSMVKYHTLKIKARSEFYFSVFKSPTSNWTPVLLTSTHALVGCNSCPSAQTITIDPHR